MKFYVQPEIEENKSVKKKKKKKKVESTVSKKDLGLTENAKILME